MNSACCSRLSDGPEFVALWYAVLKIGAVVSEVYTFLQPKDYEYYLSYSRAQVAVVDATTLDAVRLAASELRARSDPACRRDGPGGTW